MLRHRLHTAGSRHRRRGRLARPAHADGRRREHVRRVPRGAGRPDDDRGRHPADVRGLYRFYEELALRFAERGTRRVAFDYFGRTAGASQRDDDFEYRPHVEQTTDEGVQADTAPAVDRAARSEASNPCSRSASASAAARPGSQPRLATASPARLACTGARRGNGAGRAPSRARRDDVPDPGAPGRRRRRHHRRRTTTPSSEALTAAGVEHEIVVYDGAPHSFFDRKQEDFQRRRTTHGAACSSSSRALA